MTEPTMNLREVGDSIQSRLARFTEQNRDRVITLDQVYYPPERVTSAFVSNPGVMLAAGPGGRQVLGYPDRIESVEASLYRQEREEMKARGRGEEPMPRVGNRVREAYMNSYGNRILIVAATHREAQDRARQAELKPSDWWSPTSSQSLRGLKLRQNQILWAGGWWRHRDSDQMVAFIQMAVNMGDSSGR